MNIMICGCIDKLRNSLHVDNNLFVVCTLCYNTSNTGQFLLSNLGASSTSDPNELVEVASAESDVVIPSLSDIVTTYSIIPPPLTSLTSLTTTSTLESVFNEPVMSVAQPTLGRQALILMLSQCCRVDGYVIRC